MGNDTHCFRDDHDVWREVQNARRRAHEKHGENSIESVSPTDPRWLPILVEEIGEVAHTMTYDGPIDQLRSELIDVLAVASAAVDSIDGRKLLGAVSAKVPGPTTPWDGNKRACDVDNPRGPGSCVRAVGHPGAHRSMSDGRWE